MIFLNSKVELIPQEEGLDGIFKQIELVGRSCWMSQHLINDHSAISFVKHLQDNGHTASFEHGTVYLKMPNGVSGIRYSRNPYSYYVSDGTNEYITTNYRVIVENNWYDDLKYLVPLDINHHEPRITFHFTCQRAISAEFNRHRRNSPMESSSRYCNFSKNKYGKEISICVSDWIKEEANNKVTQKYFHKPTGIQAIESCNKGLEQYCYEVGNGYDIQNMNIIDYWLFANLACEYSYMNIMRLGAKAEQAREILPLDLKTDLYHTVFLSDWLHFCALRAWDTKGNHPHPEAKKLANEVFEYLKSLNLVTDKFKENLLNYEIE